MRRENRRRRGAKNRGSISHEEGEVRVEVDKGAGRDLVLVATDELQTGYNFATMAGNGNSISPCRLLQRSRTLFGPYNSSPTTEGRVRSFILLVTAVSNVSYKIRQSTFIFLENPTVQL
jgi:hypothetical protein